MIRRPTHEEEAAVRGFFQAMTRGLSSAVIGDLRLAIEAAPDQDMVVLCSQEVLDLPDDLREGQAGLPIGQLEEGAFRLGLQGAVEVAKHTELQAVRVKEKSARLFLYGRDVLGDSVLRHDRDLDVGDHCIVLDPRGSALGIGVVVGRFKGMHSAVRPVHDLGTYLRDQGA